MRNQQAAEREEQQRIKNLVLNYDLREDDQHDGTLDETLPGPIFQVPIHRKSNAKSYKAGHDHFNPSLTRAEKTGRNAPRARRLNLADVDWYDKTGSQPPRLFQDENVHHSQSLGESSTIRKKPG